MKEIPKVEKFGAAMLANQSCSALIKYWVTLKVRVFTEYFSVRRHCPYPSSAQLFNDRNHFWIEVTDPRDQNALIKSLSLDDFSHMLKEITLHTFTLMIRIYPKDHGK